MNLFDAARHKVERAGARSRELADIWNTYLAPHPFDFDLRRESPTTYIVRVLQLEPIPASMSAVFGEWLYNLRSALDYIIWAAAVHTSGRMPPPGEAGLQYPIYDDEQTWSRNLWRLRPLAAHHIDMLSSMQPFNSDPDANYLGWINRLARVDRHRRLAVSTARIAEANPVFAIPSRANPSLEWGQFVLTGGEAQLMRVTFASAAEADGVSFNPRVGIDPEIQEWSPSEFWGRVKFSERLRMMQVFVAAEVDVYEFDCTGAESARDSLTAAFQEASDRRRTEGIFPPVRHEPPATVTWGNTTRGRPSTRERLMGADFPTHGTGKR